MSSTEYTQITPAKGYDTSKMVFSEPTSGAIPDSKLKIEFKRINISTRNEDGSTGELILPTSRIFSFGVSENTSQETGKINGYTFPICLWNRDTPTDEEKAWTDTFNKIVDKCIDHLIENREEIEMFELARADLIKAKGGLNPLYWKKEKFTNDKGKTLLRTVPGSGPTLYTKLIFSKKHNKFLSQFFDTDDEPLNALDLMGKYCYTKAAIKIESIFIGSKISLQVKLYEAVIEPTAAGMRRLLSRPAACSRVLEHSSQEKRDYVGRSNPVNLGGDNSDEGSLVDGDGDDDNDVLALPNDEVRPSSPPKSLTRRVKKVNKK